MSRVAAVPALLGALATTVLTFPLTPLFDDDGWVRSAILGVVVVLVSGIALRSVTHRVGLVVLGQSLVSGFYLLHAHLGSTTAFGLPTLDTVGVAIDRFDDARETISTHAAPAPATAGVSLMLCVVVVLVALAVDLAAATAESPAIAGIPLLSLFLVSAANADGQMHPGWFLTGAAIWLLLLAQRTHEDAARWTTVVPMLPGQGGREATDRQLGRQAVQVGIVVLALALVLPRFLPHLPQRYVLDGLGGGTGIGNAGGGDLRLSTELDLHRSLQSQSTDPVLRYRTDDPSPEPLRVAVVDRIRDGRVTMSAWSPPRQRGFAVPDLLADTSDGVARETRTLTVVENGIGAPQLPTPAGLTSVDIGDIPYSVTAQGAVTVEAAPDQYSAESLEVAPEPDDFPSRTATIGDSSTARSGDLDLDSGSETEITELATSLAPEDAPPLQVAQRIQEHLRGDDYTYSLELAPRSEPEDSDAVLHFLRTKQGYCQQFATTMVLLARARGIPSRLVVGFLPGMQQGDERVVRANDAHAWPELYFEGVGWTRFEPTPGSDAASTPGYSFEADEEDPSETSDSETTSTSSSTSEATSQPEDDTAVDETTDGTAEGPAWWHRPLLVLLGIALVLSIMPLTATLARRRRRAQAADDAARVEREWQELVSRLGDLGINPPTGATPRQTGVWLGSRLSLPAQERERLGAVVGTLERARYAPPGQDLPDIADDVDLVVGHARGSRQTSQRLRALLWPRDGVAAWRSLGASASAWLSGRPARVRRRR